MKKKSMITLKENDYNHYIEVAKEIDKQKPEGKDKFSLNFYNGKHDFPTVFLLKSSEIERKLEKYLPYLIYYKDVYQSSLDGVTEMKAYLEDVFKKRVRFISNDHLEAVRKTGLIFWKKTTAEERYERFKPLMSNYKLNEFDEFLSDLEYCSFMKFYGLRRTAFNNSKLPIKLIADLSDIWGVYEKDSNEEEKETENKDKK
jgi:hypothetical protein